MIKSNQPVLPNSAYQGQSSLNSHMNKNLSTIDNIKVREQMRSIQKSRNNGNSQAASKAAMQKHLAEQVGRATIRPLIRKHNAREYAND